MSRATHGLLALLGVAALTAATASAPVATAAEAEPWQPVTQESFTAPAGKYCTFPFTYRPDEQHLEMQVRKRFPDGSVKVVAYRGPLVGTTTNDESGAQITRDSSGDAVQRFRRDGTLKVYTARGNVGIGFVSTDDYPQGYYQLGGFHRIAFDRDGTKTMRVDRGTEENICATLADSA